MNREQLAWAAGIIDGEGNISDKKITNILKDGTKSPSHSMLINVSQTAKYGGIPEMAIRLQTIFPFSKIRGPYENKKKPEHSDVYQWAAQGFERVQYIMCLLWTWLGTQKKKDYKNALEEYTQYIAKRRRIND